MRLNDTPATLVAKDDENVSLSPWDEELKRMNKVLDEASKRRIKDFERILDEYHYGAKAIAEKYRQDRKMDEHGGED